MFRKIKEASYHFQHEEFNTVTDECKDLINKLLVVKESNRLSGIEALNHKWFKKMEKMPDGAAAKKAGDVKISDDVL